jgi:hypothetical protein
MSDTTRLGYVSDSFVGQHLSGAVCMAHKKVAVSCKQTFKMVGFHLSTRSQRSSVLKNSVQELAEQCSILKISDWSPDRVISLL